MRRPRRRDTRECKVRAIQYQTYRRRDAPPSSFLSTHYHRDTISSLGRRWAASLLETAKHSSVDTDAVEKTWLAMAKEADRINGQIMAGLKPPGSGDCEAGPGQTSRLHMCAVCGRSSPCCELEHVEFTDHIVVCRRCRHGRPHRFLNPMEPLLRAKLKHIILSDILSIRPPAARKVDPEVREQVNSMVVNYLESLEFEENGLTYVDGYSGERVTFPARPSPYSPSTTPPCLWTYGGGN